MFPQLLTGLVLRGDDEVVEGNCAAYVTRHTFITAAHCAPEDQELWVLEPFGGEQGATGPPKRPDPRRKVVSVMRLPEADIALLVVDPPQSAELVGLAYQRPEGLIMDGDFIGYGYPEEGFEAAVEPVGRTFKGHFMRYFTYERVRPYTFFAGEMSIPAPRGLSGGPLSYQARPAQLAAVVAQNMRSHVTVEGEKAAMSYGVAVMLYGAVLDWLDARLPSGTPSGADAAESSSHPPEG